MPDNTKRMWGENMRKGHRRMSKVTLKRGFPDSRDTERSERVLRDHLL